MNLSTQAVRRIRNHSLEREVSALASLQLRDRLLVAAICEDGSMSAWSLPENMAEGQYAGVGSGTRDAKIAVVRGTPWLMTATRDGAVLGFKWTDMWNTDMWNSDEPLEARPGYVHKLAGENATLAIHTTSKGSLLAAGSSGGLLEVTNLRSRRRTGAVNLGIGAINVIAPVLDRHPSWAVAGRTGLAIVAMNYSAAPRVIDRLDVEGCQSLCEIPGRGPALIAGVSSAGVPFLVEKVRRRYETRWPWGERDRARHSADSAVRAGSMGGQPVVVTVSGRLAAVWSPDDQEPLLLDAHQSAISAMTTGTVDGACVLVSGDSQGDIFTWDLECRPEPSYPFERLAGLDYPDPWPLPQHRSSDGMPLSEMIRRGELVDWSDPTLVANLPLTPLQEVTYCSREQTACPNRDFAVDPASGQPVHFRNAVGGPHVHNGREAQAMLANGVVHVRQVADTGP